MRPLSAPAPARTRFVLPTGAHATAPPEVRGLPRDGVRLLVARPERVQHHRFDALPGLLAAGDLLVVNTSATLPAAVDARIPGRAVRTETTVHIGDELEDGTWVLEVRLPDRSGPDRSLTAGQVLSLAGGVRVRLLDSYPTPGRSGSRLWQARPAGAAGRVSYLTDHGRPVAYDYVTAGFPLATYQTVYAGEPGSAELVSAGRPVSERLLARLVTAGVTVAPVLLHAGLSSPEAHEPPVPERFEVPEHTARLVRQTRAAGGRVVAVGTTVVRALESAVDPTGTVVAASGRTGLVLDVTTPARVVDGLVSGLHEPQASHLALLEAVAGADLVAAAYAAAVRAAPRDGRPGEDTGYLWHEFGDSMLLLPGRVPRGDPGPGTAGRRYRSAQDPRSSTRSGARTPDRVEKAGS